METITIKAFKKDEKGRLYCQPFREKFYYEVGKTYYHKGNVELSLSGFHASANCDISETVDYYFPDNYVAYCIVNLNILDKDKDKAVGNKITIIKELTTNKCLSYDKTGRWVYNAGLYLYVFDYVKGLKRLLDVDKSGQWLYYAGRNWDWFDYKRGLKRLKEIESNYYQYALYEWKTNK